VRTTAERVRLKPRRTSVEALEALGHKVTRERESEVRRHLDCIRILSFLSFCCITPAEGGGNPITLFPNPNPDPDSEVWDAMYLGAHDEYASMSPTPPSPYDTKTSEPPTEASNTPPQAYWAPVENAESSWGLSDLMEEEEDEGNYHQDRAQTHRASTATMGTAHRMVSEHRRASTEGTEGFDAGVMYSLAPRPPITRGKRLHWDCVEICKLDPDG